MKSVQQLPVPSDDDLPPVVVATRAARTSFLYEDTPELADEGSVEDGSDQDVPQTVAFTGKTECRTRPEGRIRDPFEAFMDVLKQQGRKEDIELHTGGISMKFRVLAVQVRTPLVALITDAATFNVDIPYDTDLTLKVRHKVYPARFIANMSFTSGLNLILFVADEPESGPNG